MRKSILMAVVITGLFLTGEVLAGGCEGGDCSLGGKTKEGECGHSKKRKTEIVREINAATAAAPKLKKGELAITGTLVCTSCNLKKKGAKSQCGVYGCAYAINIEKAINRKGKSVKEHIGKLYHILATDSSANLLQKKYKDSKVITIGKIFSDERIVEIRFVKLAPAKK